MNKRDNPKFWFKPHIHSHSHIILTEDIWASKSHCVEKFGISGEEFDRMFGIPEDFDTLP